ncbi:hypothetical protein [Massilibacteroides sp.]|uniref:GumC family protein n=1 Tax=Massilibacteroides sp. TaxID=2034766 RepID=UPI00260C8520|nr:hypothetical protein [Massilibacteroides sp.]MDD4514741.1 hypothetical protein [Massilibacteroides sp.]
MDFIQYIFRFLFRIRWWLIIAPIVITLLVIVSTRNMLRTYHVDMTIYTGVVSGFAMETGETMQNSTVVNNTIDNIINIIKSKETLNEVSLHLYARHMIYGDPEKDNAYINAENYKSVLRITPKEVLALIDKSSEEKTVQNLRSYEKQSPTNFVYGLFNWNHPYYCFGSLSNIKVQRLGSSDMLQIDYSANDPGVAYQTLLLLNDIYIQQYQNLQFGSTNNAIKYFERELDRVGKELKSGEDSLTLYNVENRIINYDEQTKEVAALDKEIELRYQDVLQKYRSAEASIKHIETQLGENASFLKSNSLLLSKLSEISNLNKIVSELETFNQENSSSTTRNQQLEQYKEQLSNAEKEFTSISTDAGNKKFTKSGYPTSNFVSQWIEELLIFEKSKAEKNVIEQYKQDINQKYSHFSPIGSTIKRQERNIDFIERSYLSILSSLNAARLRLKSLEMNSASLKLINPPTFPLNTEPSKRKAYVLAAFIGSFTFILGFFLIMDLLDFTLRDRVRTERITGGRVLGAFPLVGKGKYDKAREEKSTQFMSNALSQYIQPYTPTIINLISIGQKTGKTYLGRQVVDYWEEHGLNVQMLEWDSDYSAFSKEFFLARRLFDFTPNVKANIYVVEYAALSLNSIPPLLLQEATVNLLVINADSIWKESDKLLFQKLQEQKNKTSLFIYLNKASKEVVESFTGTLPPFVKSRTWAYLLYRIGLYSPQ